MVDGRSAGYYIPIDKVNSSSSNVNLFVSVCRLLHSAHSRLLSPGNKLVTRDSPTIPPESVIEQSAWRLTRALGASHISHRKKVHSTEHNR
jgi:hypothetical protein